jgi:phospholipid transport system substrate-binding protein
MTLARRRFLLIVASLAAAKAASPLVASAQAAVDPNGAVQYMREVADDLMQAQRVGTVSSFQKAIVSHADVEGIALYALGNYRDDLAKAQRPAYFKGVSLFMARYFADSSRQYQVGKAEVGEATLDDSGAALVNTKVTLMSGTTYNVVFKVARDSKGYQIADVNVLGFSLAYMQRGIFQRFIAKNGGDERVHVAALNR